MRLSAVYREGTSNAYYRVKLPLAELERRGHTVRWPATLSLAAELAGEPQWDVFVVHQFCEDSDLAAVRRLRRQGIAVVWDCDDDIAAMPRNHPAYRRYGGRRGLRGRAGLRRGLRGRAGLRRAFARTVEIAHAASLMTTPSAHLAQRYRDAGVEHVAVLENHLAARDVGLQRPRHSGVVIGLVAAGEHVQDLERLRIASALRRLIESHDGVRVVTYGERLDLPDGRYTHRGLVPIERLVAVETEFDIGLAPLADTPYSRARSNVKVREYASAGAMWVASPVGPFRGMGEEQGGLLVEDGAWYETLAGLLDDHRRRVELMERARAWARTKTIDRAAGGWEAAYRHAVERVRMERAA